MNSVVQTICFSLPSVYPPPVAFSHRSHTFETSVVASAHDGPRLPRRLVRTRHSRLSRRVPRLVSFTASPHPSLTFFPPRRLVQQRTHPSPPAPPPLLPNRRTFLRLRLQKTDVARIIRHHRHIHLFRRILHPFTVFPQRARGGFSSAIGGA